jgi:hypothetical protein
VWQVDETEGRGDGGGGTGRGRVRRDNLVAVES